MDINIIRKKTLEEGIEEYLLLMDTYKIMKSKYSHREDGMKRIEEEEKEDKEYYLKIISVLRG